MQYLKNVSSLGLIVESYAYQELFLKNISTCSFQLSQKICFYQKQDLYQVFHLGRNLHFLLQSQKLISFLFQEFISGPRISSKYLARKQDHYFSLFKIHSKAFSSHDRKPSAYFYQGLWQGPYSNL